MEHGAADGCVMSTDECFNRIFTGILHEWCEISSMFLCRVRYGAPQPVRFTLAWLFRRDMIQQRFEREKHVAVGIEHVLRRLGVPEIPVGWMMPWWYVRR